MDSFLLRDDDVFLLRNIMHGSRMKRRSGWLEQRLVLFGNRYRLCSRRWRCSSVGLSDGGQRRGAGRGGGRPAGQSRRLRLSRRRWRTYASASGSRRRPRRSVRLPPRRGCCCRLRRRRRASVPPRQLRAARRPRSRRGRRGDGPPREPEALLRRLLVVSHAAWRLELGDGSALVGR